MPIAVAVAAYEVASLAREADVASDAAEEDGAGAGAFFSSPPSARVSLRDAFVSPSGC
jgi:hypothetical protein